MARRKAKVAKETVREGRQYAALPLAVEDGETRVMLITSRETRRWIIPKGWAEPGLAPHEVAAKEAREEAGLVGAIAAEPIASYSYEKRLPKGEVQRCEVEVFPLTVARQLARWPEMKERQTRWFTFAEAALEVDEGELITLLLSLAAEEA
ncbi:MAG: NUDIX hydrolase [Geminicoccaceae bacterium]